LKNLKVLEINEKINGFPSDFFELPELEELTLISPLIKNLPDEISKLPKLKSLSLFQPWFVKEFVDVKFEELIDTLSRCHALESLDLSNSGMKKIPKSINKLKSLKVLKLSSNGIKELPEELFELTELRILDLGINQIKSIPKDIKKLGKLRELLLNSNFSAPINVENLFNSIPDLPHLQKLHLWSCQTKMEIPENIKEWEIT
jgi:Leucine-rich repeat (LRR) protein